MKKFTKSLIAGALTFSFAFVAVSSVVMATSAEEMAALQAELNALKGTAASLQGTAKENGISLTVPGCTGTKGYSTVDGRSCATNIGIGTYNFGSVTLKNGSRGEAVKELQRFLNARLNLGLAVDGVLGPKTIIVIKKWQKDHALVADGLIGAKTKAMMNASIY